MAPPSTKRRKVEHVSSEEEEEGASFASFSSGDEEVDVNDDTAGGASSGSEDEEQDSVAVSLGGFEKESGSDEDENLKQNAQQLGAAPTKNGAGSKKTSNAKDVKTKAKPARPATDTGVNAYMAGTSKSNVFRLQVDDLLEQIRPRQGAREAAAEKALHAFKGTIEQIAPRGPLSVQEAESQLLKASKVATPFHFPKPPKDAKYKLEYAKPANINVAGSHATKTASRAKGITEIDLILTMPATLFQEKDYLDHRYFYKRSYYLACVAAGIKAAHGEDYELRFQNSHDDPLKPILTVSPSSGTGSNGEKQAGRKWQVNIMPCVAPEVFAQEKLRPDKRCVRNVNTSAEQARVLTPFYNASLRADMLVLPYLKLVHAATKKCAGFQDACLLASTWLRQRGLGSSMHAGGMGSFEWSVMMALLLQSGGSGGKSMLSDGYSSYQLFKATLQLLAVKDFSKQPLMIGTDEAAMKPSGHGVPLLWDGTRGHNLFYKVMPWSYKLLRQEARTTLNMLGEESFDGFEAAFILRLDAPMYRHDYVLELDASALVGSGSRDEAAIQTAQQNLYSILQKGLSDRVNLINIAPSTSESWALGSSPISKAAQRTSLLGFIINPEAVNRTVDHGPSAEDKSGCTTFREFWGEKAELRRFKDGSIHESLVWTPKEGGHSVLEQIARYLIGKHFGMKAEHSVNMAGDGFKRLLPQGSGVTAFQPLMEAYKKLELDLRALDNMPLSIRQMMPADPQLRYASLNPPSITRRSMPADVTIQFEASGRWPDDLVAIQRTKIAFLLKMSELLQESTDSLTSRIGLENEDCDIHNQAFLDIIYNSGPAFRMRIYHDREQTLYERNLKDKTLSPSTKELSVTGLAAHKRDHLKSPAHTQAVARLCSRHPALSGAIRLTKKWFASHLLSNHISAEVIELLVIRTFVRPWPWQTPSSTQTGFLRTLLWISRWDWRADPLIVDLSTTGNELKQPDIQAITSRFDAWRKLDPALNRVVLFAASNVDPDGTTWTDGRPAKVVAGRMSALARAACAEVEAKQLAVEPASLFVSPLEDFDFVLHLNPELIGKKKQRKQKKSSEFKNLELDALNDSSLAGFDPMADFVAELERVYGSAMLLFSGGHERAVVAGLWSPLTAGRAWKLNLAYSTTPRKGERDGEVVAELNREGVLKEIARVGGDMVERIDVKGA